MAAWIPAAITAGTSILGHVLKRSNRPQSPQQVDLSFLETEIGNLRGSSTDLQNRMMGSARAGAGFANLNNNRMMNQSGIGQTMATNRQNMIQANASGFESAQGVAMNEQNQINSLLGMLTQGKFQNAGMQNNHNMSMLARNDSQINDLMTGLMQGGFAWLGAENDERNRNDFNDRFNQLLRLFGNMNQNFQGSGVMSAPGGSMMPPPNF